MGLQFNNVHFVHQTTDFEDGHCVCFLSIVSDEEYPCQFFTNVERYATYNKSSPLDPETEGRIKSETLAKIQYSTWRDIPEN